MIMTIVAFLCGGILGGIIGSLLWVTTKNFNSGAIVGVIIAIGAFTRINKTFLEKKKIKGWVFFKNEERVLKIVGIVLIVFFIVIPFLAALYRAFFR